MIHGLVFIPALPSYIFSKHEGIFHFRPERIEKTSYGKIPALIKKVAEGSGKVTPPGQFRKGRKKDPMGNGTCMKHLTLPIASDTEFAMIVISIPGKMR